jgi:signal transduction histidine kinase
MRFRDISVATRLPLLAGIAVFATSAATSQLTIFSMDREVSRQSETLAAVYLDSLSGAVVQALESRDVPALQVALERALGFQVGVVDRIIAVGRPDGTIIARAGATDADPPMARGEYGDEWEPTVDGGMAWAQRRVVLDGQVVAVAAVQLAFPNLVERRRGHRVRLGIASLFLGGLAALLATRVAGRIMTPVLDVAQTLENMAVRGNPSPDPARRTEGGRLAAALESLLARLREREELAARLAERERIAVLGRLAATVAHEVRNPLAGMLTAIDTIRHFGADATVRDRSLNLLERGLRQIEVVVQTTLATHRSEVPRRPMAAEDLDDLKVLVQPEARRRGVELTWEIAVSEPFRTDAVQLRQIVLNLLLNAIAASPPGGRVTLRARPRNAGLLVEISDEAGGLPEEAWRMLASGAPGGGDGLGLEVAGRLAAGLHATIDIEGGPHGTCIRLHVPAPEQSA